MNDDRKIDQMRRDLKKLTGELLKVQKEWEGETMPADVRTAYDEKAKEGEEVQQQIEEATRDLRAKKLERFLREVPDENIHLPADSKEEQKKKSNAIAGYVTLGQHAVLSKAYEEFVAKGAPRGEFPLVRVDETIEHGNTLYVPVTKAQREVIEEKTIPTLGAGVIEPQRLAVTPQVTADRQLRIRDVLQVGRTSTNSLHYIREESYTRAAGYHAGISVKAEATASYTEQVANVLTIAVWMPATVNQLADWGQLRSLIDGRLRYDIRLKEEEEIVYGPGGATAFEGLAVVTGTQDIATADARITSPTIIDQIMVGATEIRRAGYEPNAVLLDPIDYEAVNLIKGTDDHYLRQVFPSAGGELRVWNLQMVATQAMERTGATERNLIVGDFQRGAGLFLREDINVMLGMKDDDFIRNLRTVLAEERAAFAIFAPAAFAVLQTEA